MSILRFLLSLIKAKWQKTSSKELHRLSVSDRYLILHLGRLNRTPPDAHLKIIPDAEWARIQAENDVFYAQFQTP